MCFLTGWRLLEVACRNWLWRAIWCWLKHLFLVALVTIWRVVGEHLKWATVMICKPTTIRCLGHHPLCYRFYLVTVSNHSPASWGIYIFPWEPKVARCGHWLVSRSVWLGSKWVINLLNIKHKCDELSQLWMKKHVHPQQSIDCITVLQYGRQLSDNEVTWETLVSLPCTYLLFDQHAFFNYLSFLFRSVMKLLIRKLFEPLAGKSQELYVK